MRTLESLASALYGVAEPPIDRLASRRAPMVAVVSAGAIPIVAGALILFLARGWSWPGGGSAPVAAPSVVPTTPGRVPEPTARSNEREMTREPGVVVRREGGSTPGEKPAEAPGTRDADEALRRARYELEQRALEAAALRRELSATRDELQASKARVGSLAQELDRRLEELHAREGEVQRALSRVREAELAQEVEAGKRAQAEAARDRFEASLAETHVMYAPMTPARIEHRREALTHRRLAQKAGAPLGVVWDALGDLIVGFAEAVGGPAGEPGYVAHLAGGGEVAIDRDTAQRWEKLGVRVEERVRPAPEAQR